MRGGTPLAVRLHRNAGRMAAKSAAESGRAIDNFFRRGQLSFFLSPSRLENQRKQYSPPPSQTDLSQPAPSSSPTPRNRSLPPRTCAPRHDGRPPSPPASTS